MKKALSVLALVLFAPVHAQDPPPPPWMAGRKPPAATEQACRSLGGTWTKTPIMQTDYCNVRTRDGGKACKKSSDCESAICTSDRAEIVAHACHGETLKFGTFWYLDQNGKRQMLSIH